MYPGCTERGTTHQLRKTFALHQSWICRALIGRKILQNKLRLLQAGAKVSVSTSAAMLREFSAPPNLASWILLAIFQPTPSQKVIRILSEIFRPESRCFNHSLKDSRLAMFSGLCLCIQTISPCVTPLLRGRKPGLALTSDLDTSSSKFMSDCATKSPA